MKAILEFNLPEENDEYMRAMHGKDVAIQLFAFNQELRSILKYKDDQYSEEVLDFAQKLRDNLYEKLAKYEVF